MTQTPSVRIGDTLIITLRGDLDDTAVLEIEENVSREVESSGVRGTLIDVSGLTIVDSFIARVLTRIASMIRLLGSQVALVGIQPAVAITLVELGVPMGHLETALNAEQGIALLARLRGDDDRAH